MWETNPTHSAGRGSVDRWELARKDVKITPTGVMWPGVVWRVTLKGVICGIDDQYGVSLQSHKLMKLGCT